MMNQVAELNYAEQAGVQAVEIPYAGGEMSMLILLPATGAFEAFAQNLGVEEINTLLNELKPTGIQLKMPGFQFTSNFKLKEALMALGMVNAFGDADFSGIDGKHELFIHDVYHQAFIAVDESGTEAAAAAAVVVDRKGGPQASMDLRLDHPFIFLIRDRGTGTVLLMGHVVNPPE
jgi:serpin B